MDKEININCKHYSIKIRIDKDSFPALDFNPNFVFNYTENQLSIKKRIKILWNIIMHKSYKSDDLILHVPEVAALEKYIGCHLDEAKKCLDEMRSKKKIINPAEFP